MELRPNRDHTEFYELTPEGSLELAATVSETSVSIRTKHLRQYQAARQLDLVRFIDSYAWVPGDHLASFDADYGNHVHEVSGERCRLRLVCFMPDFGSRQDSTGTMLMGKKLIESPPQERAGIWPWDRSAPEEYQDFIIGEDEFGEPILHSCNPSVLANYFGANPGAPHYLTPVWFSSEVLQKYYLDPDKYTVTEGSIRCGSLWIARIDNDNPDGYVMVWLGDLGTDFPAAERDHWKAHNAIRDKLGSATAVKRQLLNQWTDAESPVFKLKQEHRRFREAWRERFDWDLLRALDGPNAAALDRLRTPLNASETEFESIAEDLHLVMVESLNSRELKKVASSGADEEKSISLLESWLRDLGYAELDRDISFLRTLNEVRSKTSHYRSSKHAERLRELGVGEDRVAAMQAFFASAATMLESLREFIDEIEQD